MDYTRAESYLGGKTDRPYGTGRATRIHRRDDGGIGIRYHLCPRAIEGLQDKTANHDGEGIRRACKAVGIKHTAKAIREYLSTPGTLQGGR